MAIPNLNRILTPGVYSIGAAVAMQGFAMLTFVMLARTLSFQLMGAWALWLTFSAIGDMTRQGFIQNGLARYTAIAPEAWKNWLTASAILNLAAGVVLGLLLTGVAFLLSVWFNMPEFTVLTIWALPVVLLQSNGKFAEAIQVAKKDFKGIFRANCVNGGLQFGLTAWYFWNDMAIGMTQLVGIQAAGILGGLVIAILFCKKHLLFGQLEKARITELARYGKYVAGTNFFSLLFQRLDTLLIGAFLTPAAIAIYNVATRLNSLLDLPLNGLSLTQFPKLAEAHAQTENIQPAFERSVRQLAFVQAPLSILMIITAPWAVQLLAGDSYKEAVPLLQLLAVSGLVKPWGRTFGLALDAAGKSKMNFRMLLLSLAINLALNLLMIPVWGIAGAAIATSLGVLITTAIGQQFLRRMLDVKPWCGLSLKMSDNRF